MYPGYTKIVTLNTNTFSKIWQIFCILQFSLANVFLEQLHLLPK